MIRTGAGRRTRNELLAFFPEVTIQTADNALTTSCMWQTHNSHSILSDLWDCGRVLCPCSILWVLSPSTWLITVSCAPYSFPLKTALNQLDIPSQQISHLESASKVTHQFFFWDFMLHQSKQAFGTCKSEREKCAVSILENQLPVENKKLTWKYNWVFESKFIMIFTICKEKLKQFNVVSGCFAVWLLGCSWWFFTSWTIPLTSVR